MSPKQSTSKFPEIILKRLTGKDLDDYMCVCCKDGEDTYTTLLDLTLGECSFFLCPDHEAKLLASLLANYVRRLERRKILPALVKEPEEKEEVEQITWNPVTNTFTEEAAE